MLSKAFYLRKTSIKIYRKLEKYDKCLNSVIKIQSQKTHEQKRKKNKKNILSKPKKKKKLKNQKKF